MKTIEEIASKIAETTELPEETIAFHLKRIARKFDYELSGKQENILDNKDASDVEFITARFLYERLRKEKLQKGHTRLIPIVKVAQVRPKTESMPVTKPMPIVK